MEAFDPNDYVTPATIGSLDLNTGTYHAICNCTGKCENGTKTCSGGELPKDKELRLLREAVKTVLALPKSAYDDDLGDSYDLGLEEAKATIRRVLAQP